MFLLGHRASAVLAPFLSTNSAELLRLFIFCTSRFWPFGYKTTLESACKLDLDRTLVAWHQWTFESRRPWALLFCGISTKKRCHKAATRATETAQRSQIAGAVRARSPI